MLNFLLFNSSIIHYRLLKAMGSADLGRNELLNKGLFTTGVPRLFYFKNETFSSTNVSIYPAR